jgi:hypothetical protein
VAVHPVADVVLPVKEVHPAEEDHLTDVAHPMDGAHLHQDVMDGPVMAVVALLRCRVKKFVVSPAKAVVLPVAEDHQAVIVDHPMATAGLPMEEADHHPVLEEAHLMIVADHLLWVDALHRVTVLHRVEEVVRRMAADHLPVTGADHQVVADARAAAVVDLPRCRVKKFAA